LIPTTYRVLFPDNQVLHASIDWPETPDRAQIHALVRPYFSGEEPEHVLVWHMERLHNMFVPEMGFMRLAARASLDINWLATAIYRSSYARLYPEVNQALMPTIAGAAVLFDRIVCQ
jgi:hypothetical protein